MFQFSRLPFSSNQSINQQSKRKISGKKKKKHFQFMGTAYELKKFLQLSISSKILNLNSKKGRDETKSDTSEILKKSQMSQSIRQHSSNSVNIQDSLIRHLQILLRLQRSHFSASKILKRNGTLPFFYSITAK